MGDAVLNTDNLEQEDYEVIGEILADARKNHGLEISDVSQVLNIRPKYLRSIEAGTLGDLPSAIYIKGYLQNYADFLGLDAAEIVAGFNKKGELDKKDDYYHVVPEVKGPDYSAIVMISAALVVISYLFWYNFVQDESASSQIVRDVPQDFKKYNEVTDAGDDLPWLSNNTAPDNFVGPNEPQDFAVDSQSKNELLQNINNNCDNTLGAPDINCAKQIFKSGIID